MNRTCEPVAMPPSLTCKDLAPSGTVTKYDVVWLRSTVPERVIEYDGCVVSVETTTVLRTAKSTPAVAASSSRMMALCAPARARTTTGMLTAWISGRFTAGQELYVPSFPTHTILWVRVAAGPLVRVTLTVYVVVWPGLSPPASAAHRL